MRVFIRKERTERRSEKQPAVFFSRAGRASPVCRDFNQCLSPHPGGPEKGGTWGEERRCTSPGVWVTETLLLSGSGLILVSS